MINKSLIHNIKFICLFALSSLWFMQLSGCATGMAMLESGAESMNPTIMATLDSFESGALAIKTSNKIMMEVPISEQTQWQGKLSSGVTGEGGVKMGAALFGSSQGVTIATEVDPESGFPRPTSALYLLIKERNTMLDKETPKGDVIFFKRQKANVIYRDPGANKPLVYRNLLMAYGTVMNNKDDVNKFQQKLEQLSVGFRQCDSWIKSSTEGSVAPTFCKDSPLLKDETFRIQEVTKGLDEKTDLENKYGKLAKNVYDATFAGADFSIACSVKLASALINGIRALPNAANEFKGLKGSYNMALLLPRIKNVVSSVGFYKDNLMIQLSAYKTMYQQIKGTYEIKEDPKEAQKTKEALHRMQQAESVLAAIEPKLQMAKAGMDVEFTDEEVGKLDQIIAQYPIQPIIEHKFIIALRQIVQP